MTNEPAEKEFRFVDGLVYLTKADGSHKNNKDGDFIVFGFWGETTVAMSAEPQGNEAETNNMVGGAIRSVANSLNVLKTRGEPYFKRMTDGVMSKDDKSRLPSNPPTADVRIAPYEEFKKRCEEIIP